MSQEKVLIKTEDGYPISRCRRCALIFVSRTPEVEQGKVIGEYYSGSDREVESSRLRYKRVSQFLAEQINRLKPAKGKLLEIVPSRLSSKAARNIVYRAFEAFVGVLYIVSFRTINLSPTLLAIAVKRN